MQWTRRALVVRLSLGFLIPARQRSEITQAVATSVPLEYPLPPAPDPQSDGNEGRPSVQLKRGGHTAEATAYAKAVGQFDISTGHQRCGKRETLGRREGYLLCAVRTAYESSVADWPCIPTAPSQNYRPRFGFGFYTVHGCDGSGSEMHISALAGVPDANETIAVTEAEI